MHAHGYTCIVKDKGETTEGIGGSHSVRHVRHKVSNQKRRSESTSESKPTAKHNGAQALM